MESTLTLAEEQATRSGAKRIVSLQLRIGALSGVVPEALEFAFDSLAAGSIADGADLMIESVPARFWCNGCREEFGAENQLAECPQCGKASIELRAGRELEFISMEVE